MSIDVNCMHNKIAVCDDHVVTGSFNFSRNATMNAENILVIESKRWADQFSAYIDRLVKIYGK
jgi:phosphatidylserine/phosphatidylglycerophosphate/cardiolipin synthase-like enzyme